MTNPIPALHLMTGRARTCPPRRAARMSRMVALGVSAVMLGVAVVGCDRFTPQSPAAASAQQDQNIADIKAQVAKIPGVVSTGVVCVRSATLQAPKLEVGVGVRPGQAYDPIAREIIRIVWSSRLTPLEIVGIGLVHVGGQDDQNLTLYFTDSRTQKELTAKYGPRPTATDSS